MRQSIISGILGGTLLLLLTTLANAGGPVGHVETIEGGLRLQLTRLLDAEGYLGKFRNGQHFSRAASAYLWDNRSALKQVDFHDELKIDVLTCLMQSRGYPGLDKYTDSQSFKQFCTEVLH